MAGSAEQPELQAIIDAMPDPVVVVDRNGIAVAANSPALMIVKELRLGQPIDKTFHSTDVIEAVKRAVATSARPDPFRRKPVRR